MPPDCPDGLSMDVRRTLRPTVRRVKRAGVRLRISEPSALSDVCLVGVSCDHSLNTFKTLEDLPETAHAGIEKTVVECE